MNFRVIASVKKRTPHGAIYPHAIWVGEFCNLAHDEVEAREHARRRVREVVPHAGDYDIAVEEIPDIHSHH